MRADDGILGEGRPLSVAMIGLRGIPATYGGVEDAVEALSVELVKRGHAVTVYGRSAYSESRAPSYRGVSLRYLPQVNTKHLEAASHTLLAVADAVRQRRFDVIHLHATGPAVFSVIPRVTRTPCVATIQGLDWKREKWGRGASRLLRVAARVASTVPDRTIVVSRQLEREVRERYGATTTYIPNGVDPERFEEPQPVDGLEPDGYLLFLGRLVPEKGLHTLIRAYRRTSLDRDLVIAGPASHSEGYVRELSSLAAGDERIRLIGPRYGGEKSWLLRNAAAFAQPSTIEGLPIALLEAGACARYAVVSDIPENVEVVTDGERLLGRSFPAGDEAALAAALEAALADPARASTGEELRRLVLERYDWRNIAAETEREYRAALSQRSRRRSPPR